MKTDAPTVVHVTDSHIRAAIPGDCLRCAVALALDDATDDKECMIVEKEWTLYLVVWGRYLVAPERVRRFVSEYDGLERMESGCARLPRELQPEVAPFDFELPPINDPAWEESCYRCEELFSPTELDDEGYCEDCRKGEDAS